MSKGVKGNPKYRSSAERQAAYRERKAQQTAEPIATVQAAPQAAQLPDLSIIRPPTRHYGEVDRIDQPKANSWQTPSSSREIDPAKTLADFMEKP